MRGQCQLCEGMIINPICVRCWDKVARQLFINRRDYFVVHELIDDLTLFKQESIPCIVCGRRNAVCSSCFSREASRLVKEKGLSERLLQFFTLDLIKKPL